MSREPFDAVNAPALDPAHFVSGNAEQPATKGRKRKHTCDADKLAAFREQHSRFDFTTSKRIGQTVSELATQFGCSKNDVLNSLVRFALTNRNCKQVGLWGMGHQEPEELQ